MTVPLVIWGIFNWNEKRQLLKHNVIWFFCSTQTTNERKEPLRIGFMVSCSFSVPRRLELLLRLQHKWVCCILYSAKTFPKFIFEMKVQVQLSMKKGTRNNMLKFFGNSSLHLTPCPSEERAHKTLPEELRHIRWLQVGLPLTKHSPFSWVGGWGVKQSYKQARLKKMF